LDLLGRSAPLASLWQLARSSPHFGFCFCVLQPLASLVFKTSTLGFFSLIIFGLDLTSELLAESAFLAPRAESFDLGRSQIGFEIYDCCPLSTQILDLISTFLSEDI